MKAAAALAPGSALGRYEIVREVGRGGMCQVFEAVHRGLRKTVAVKTLNPELAGRPDVVERFLREGRAASRIRHRHVVDVIDVGEEGGVVYLAMEFLVGEDLSQRVRRAGALAPAEAIELLLPVLSAVAEVHRAGVIHRDLKPANLFLATDRHGAVEPKVLDFGISKLADDDGAHPTATEATLGTPAYMAPEQIERARDVTPATDVYALGVILYQCLTGRVPFRGANPYETMHLVLHADPAPPRTLRPELPPALDAAVLRAMARAPADRFASVEALGAALLPFADGLTRARWAVAFSGAPSAAVPHTPAPDAPGTLSPATRSRPPRRAPRPVLHAVAALIAALALATMVVAWGLWSRPPATPSARAAAPPTAPFPDAPPVARTTPPATAVAPAAAAPPVVEVTPAPARAAPTPRTRRPAARSRGPLVERAPSGVLIVR